MLERLPILAVTLILWLLPVASMAESRIALVVGNGAYDAVSPLNNPVGDATLIAETLGELGFQVSLVTDADRISLATAIAQFGRDLRDAGADATGLFYYAGHGVQSFGANYLLPVDVALGSQADLDFAAIEAEAVLRQMFAARNQTNIFILDACRDNPFEDLPSFGDNGLAEMKAPTGTFLAYATAPGEVAYDGSGANSPFTSALTVEMTVPGRGIEEMFRAVRVRVLEETAGLQTPWDTSSLTRAFVFAEAEQEPDISPEIVAASQIWNSVKATGDPVQVMLFLRAYPDSPFEAEARALLSQLMDEELGVAEVEEPVTEPSADEEALIAAAQASGDIADLIAYLDAFPDGVYAEFARSELAAIEKKDPLSDGAVDRTAEAAPELPDVAIPEPGAGITFTSPLDQIEEEIAGQSISELILGSPLYPPFDGLPEELWKGQQCSNCHQWTRSSLCTQAETYLTGQAQRSLGLEHPYGIGFKLALQSWAGSGCN
ncbi:caspase family protein [Ovoidimarina sediminis]|uniref:caspase family protein n=1 Tax=Ovoidimarina sediminis TaxID=3079856 RepID=UPI0029116928|nr:caspase family protein [Rhodophyticola sp. MJ-SS7]MDU8944688.1 caspase family protein [Rhodophyticola sp. MJ-SS7]